MISILGGNICLTGKCRFVIYSKVVSPKFYGEQEPVVDIIKKVNQTSVTSQSLNQRLIFMLFRALDVVLKSIQLQNVFSMKYLLNFTLNSLPFTTFKKQEQRLFLISFFLSFGGFCNLLHHNGKKMIKPRIHQPVHVIYAKRMSDRQLFQNHCWNIPGHSDSS